MDDDRKILMGLGVIVAVGGILLAFALVMSAMVG